MILILALTITVLTPVRGQESGTDRPALSNTRLASCLVKITADPAVIPLNPETVESLLYSSAVGLKAAREVLDIETPDNIRDLVEIQWLDASPAGTPSSPYAMLFDTSQPNDRQMMAEPKSGLYGDYPIQMGPAPDRKREPDQRGHTAPTPRRDIRVTRGSGGTVRPQIGPDGMQTVTLQLIVHLDGRPAAREFMTEIADRLAQTLVNAYRDYERELQMRLDFTKTRWNDATHELETIRGQVAESVDRPPVETDIKGLSDYQSVLSETIRTFELKIAGMQARKEAISKEIAETRDRAQTQLAGDAITNELMRIIEINENNLATLHKMADSGRASTAEVAQASENLARARIELAKRREELARQAGGGQLDDLNRQLSMATIEMAGDQAELDLRRQQLQEVQEQLAQATTFNPEAARIRMAQNAMEILEDRIAELQTRLAGLQSPTLVVIGAN